MQVVSTVLKKVSRSFYLSLRLLPGPMRDAAGLAYLLARTSDTIADSPRVEIQTRKESLEEFSKQLAGELACKTWPAELVMGVVDPRERELLTMSHRVVERAHELPDSELKLVLGVLRTIIDGQSFDLEAFGSGTQEQPAIMPSRQELDAYTYKVAGCVGEFWTRLGFETLGEKFSNEPVEDLLEKSCQYGKGLQLVNILRDLPNDLKAGRCYLPVDDPFARKKLLAEHVIQRGHAQKYLGEGLAYASKLNGRRVRMASVLPAMMAEDTLVLLDNADWSSLEAGVKITRTRVYADLLQSLFF